MALNLRWLVLALLLANLLLWGWARGALREFGLAPHGATEPDRIERQIKPGAVRVLPAGAVEAPPARRPAAAIAPLPAAVPDEVAEAPAEPIVIATSVAPEADPECLESGPFDEAQASALRRAMTAWPDDAWRLDASITRGRWMVYLGGLASADALRARRVDLLQRGIDIASPGAALEPGLSLGRFSTQEAAGRALAELRARGVDGLRVVAERPEAATYALHLPRVDAALRARLAELPLAGREWHACG